MAEIRVKFMKKNLLLTTMLALSVLTLSACTSTAETTVAQGESTTALASGESSASVEATSSSAAGSQAADAGTDNVLALGFDQNFPPMGFIDENGEFTGFDLELAAEAAKRMGMELKLQPIAWDAKEFELDSGNIDLIWNGFTINGREDDYTWSKPYMENKQVFVVAKDAGIATVADLSGKAVGVQLDSSAEKALADKPELSQSFASIVSSADYNTAFQDLEMGVVDAVAMDIIVAGYQLEKRGDDKFIILENEPIATEEYGIGFKLGNTELRDKLDATLLEMSEDGTMKTISEKWFGTDVTIIEK